MEDMKSDISKHDQRICGLENDIQKVKEQQPSVEMVGDEILKEIAAREQRKRNVVVYGFKEEEMGSQDSLREQGLSYINSLLTEPFMRKEDMDSVRIVKRKPSSQAAVNTRKEPILIVQLTDVNIKRKLMDEYMKNKPNKKDRSKITSDYTRNQRL